MDRIIRDLANTIRKSDAKRTSAYDTTAEVRRIDGQTAWVHIDGGVDETPVKLTVNAKQGDRVQVRVGGGRAWITGNATAPPTDDTVARNARARAQEAVQEIATTNRVVKTIRKAVDAVTKIAGNTAQYFWHTETGTDTGVHITEIPREDFLADPENGGGNLLARSNGIAIRDGLTELAQFSADGVHIGAEGDSTFSASSDGIDMSNETGTSMFKIGKRPITGQLPTQYQFIYKNQVPAVFEFPYNVELSSIGFRSASNSIVSPSVSGSVYDHVSATGNKVTIDSELAQAMIAVECTYVLISCRTSGATPYYIFGSKYPDSDVGKNCVLIGQFNANEGENSVVIGNHNYISGSDSYVFGEHNECPSNLSSNIIIGQYNKPRNYEQIVIGRGISSAGHGDILIGCGSKPNYDVNIGKGSSDNIPLIGADVAGIYHNGQRLSTAVTQKGVITTSNVASHSYEDFSTTFNVPFESTPVVVVGLNSTSTGYGTGSVSVAVSAASTTGFTARVFNNDTSARSPYVNWIAIV